MPVRPTRRVHRVDTRARADPSLCIHHPAATLAVRLIGALKLLGADENSPICVNAFPRTPFAIDH